MKKNTMRELSAKEMKAVSGSAGVKGNVKFNIKFYLGKRPGPG
ncbi:hypothetical protein VSX61_12770 [Brenneria populi subsp. brevivirga]|uniref:Bacteriocin n=1 Tax=Brenneria populi TaxID=1505588 RepID=A0ABU6JKT4_9GAMM|nr:hypothetical protein [Brenneria populi subsp. brevivirga]MEC5341195.1 hypothetical protein [Brenneria populi Li et al. 2015]